MAPPPEYDKEPKAPDKSATNISTEDSKLLHSLVNDQHSNSDHKSTNTVTAVEVENKKHVETLDDGQLKALLDEAINYKNPKDREGKSKIFKELLEEAEQESDEQACEAAARALSGCRVRRGRRGPALPHSNSLQDLVAALAAEPPRKHHVRHHPPPHAPTPNVSARAIHGGSLPSGVDTSSLSEEPARGAGYLATVRCVNPPPLAERRVSASDANAPAELELLNRRSKPMFPMTYTARATLEIGSGAVCSGRAVTTTTASNQVRTHQPQARLLNALFPMPRQSAASQGKTNTPRGPNHATEEMKHESLDTLNDYEGRSATAQERNERSHKSKIENRASSKPRTCTPTAPEKEMYSRDPKAPIDRRFGPTCPNPSIKKTPITVEKNKYYGESSADMNKTKNKMAKSTIEETKLCLSDSTTDVNETCGENKENPSIEKNVICSPKSKTRNNKASSVKDRNLPTKKKNKKKTLVAKHEDPTGKKKEISIKVTNDHKFTIQDKNTCSQQSNIPSGGRDLEYRSGNDTNLQQNPKQSNLMVEEIPTYNRECDNKDVYAPHISEDQKHAANYPGSPGRVTNIKPTKEKHDQSRYSQSWVANVDNWYKTLPNYDIKMSKIQYQNRNFRSDLNINGPNNETMRDMTKTESVLMKENPMIHSFSHSETESHNLDYIQSHDNKDTLSKENYCDNIKGSIIKNKHKINKYDLVVPSLRDPNPRNIKSMTIGSPQKKRTEYVNILPKNADAKSEISSHDSKNEDSIDKNNELQNETNIATNQNSVQDDIDSKNKSSDVKSDIGSHDLENKKSGVNDGMQNECVSANLNIDNKDSVHKNTNTKNKSSHVKDKICSHDPENEKCYNDFKNECIVLENDNVDNEVENRKSSYDNLDPPSDKNVDPNINLQNESSIHKLLNIDVGNNNDPIGINANAVKEINDGQNTNIVKPIQHTLECYCDDPNCGKDIELTDMSKQLSDSTTNDIELKDFKTSETESEPRESFLEFLSQQQRMMVDIESVQENSVTTQANNNEYETVLIPLSDYDGSGISSNSETANDTISTIEEAYGNQVTVLQSGIVLPPEFCDNAYFLLTLPSSNNNIDPFVSETSKTKIDKKKENLSVAPSNTNKKEDALNKNILKVLLFENLLKNDNNDKSGTTGVSAIDEVEVDSAISFSCITTPEVVASCNTTSSAQAAVAVDPKPRSVISSSFNGLPLSRPGLASAPPDRDDYKKSLDENGNSVQGFSSPLSGSSQHKKPRRKKSSKNETVIDCQQIDGYQGDKDVNELLRFIESNADHGRAPKLPRPKHKDDSDDKSTKKRSAERRKDKESKMKRASSLEELSRTKLEDLTDAPERPDKKERRDHAPAKERRSWGDDARDAFDADAPAPELTDFQTVTKKRKPRRRTDDAERDPPRRARAPSPRRRESAPPSDRSNDSNDDMDSVHSLPDAPRAPPAPPAPQASYADIARTRHNIPDLIESCNFYAEDAPPRRDPAAPGDADGYPALERAPRRRDAKPPPPAARRDRKERPAPVPEPSPAPDCPAPDVVADRRPPVILLDSTTRPRDMDGVTFGFDINEQLLGSGGARRPRCDLVRDAVAGVAAAAGAAGGVAVRAGCLALRYVPPEPPHDDHHLHQIVDYVGTAWEEAVRCGGKARYFSG